MSPQTLLTASHIFVLIGVLIAGLGGFGTYHYGKKVDDEKSREMAANEQTLSAQITDLTSQMASFEEIATSLYPNLTKDKAIEKLKTDFEQLQEEVQAEKDTLRSLSSRLIVTFSGEWDSDPYPLQLMSPVNHQYYVELVGPDQTIEFYASEVYTFNTITTNRAQFSSSQAVKDGTFPLGAQIDTLDSFSQINIFIPFFLGDSIHGDQVVVERMNLTFSINGIECNPLVIEQDQVVSLTGKKPNIWAILAMKVDQTTTKHFQARTDELKSDVSP